jgi:hypothetical protein
LGLGLKVLSTTPPPWVSSHMRLSSSSSRHTLPHVQKPLRDVSAHPQSIVWALEQAIQGSRCSWCSKSLSLCCFIYKIGIRWSLSQASEKQDKHKAWHMAGDGKQKSFSSFIECKPGLPGIIIYQ